MSPRAVLLVRNGVTHDARVQRAAGVLQELGFAVTIVGSITARAPEPRERLAGSDVVRLRARSPVGALRRLTRGRLPGPLAAVHRTLTTLDWNRRALRELRRLRPALVHANDFNTMWPALAARRLGGGRVLYDSHELWADRNGRREWRTWLVRAERHFVRRADAVITASPGYAAELAARYGIPAPAVVRNIPASAGPARPAAVNLREAVYVGGLMPGRGLEQAILALPHATGIRLRLVGAGAAAYVDGLVALAARAGILDRVRLDGEVPADGVVTSAARSGVGLCLIQPVCRSYELTLPNKLFEYAAAGLPVLGSDLPVIAGVVRKGGLGEVVAPGDPRAIAAALVRLTEAEGNAAARERVRSFALRETWAAEGPRLAAAYRSALR